LLNPDVGAAGDDGDSIMHEQRTRTPGRRSRCRGNKGRALHQRLRRDLGFIGKELSRSLGNVMEALVDRDRSRANGLLPDLKHLQAREDASREVCLRILALTHGNNQELRWTQSTHLILSLMERSSDEIKTIAQSVAEIVARPCFPFVRDLPEMGRVARGMLDRSTRAALRPEAEFARRIIASDSSLDRRRDAFRRKARDFLSTHPEAARALSPYLAISRHLERIGDHASHMAEEVIYYLGETSN